MLKESPTFSTIRTPSSYPASHKRYFPGSRADLIAGPMTVQKVSVPSSPEIEESGLPPEVQRPSEPAVEMNPTRKGNRGSGSNHSELTVAHILRLSGTCQYWLMRWGRR
jgi:hypothetical protein